MNLILLFSINLIGILLTTILPTSLHRIHKIVGLVTANILLVLSLYLWLNYEIATFSYQYLWSVPWLEEFNIHLDFGVDDISLFFILLTTFIFPFVILASWEIKEAKLLIFSLLAIELGLLLTFSTLDLFLFALFFESLLVPMFFIILFWGTRERRIKALTYFVIYTLLGSVFIILALFTIYFELGSTNFEQLQFAEIAEEKQLVIWLLLFLTFAIKIPMCPFHIWLPEAHVEAPTVGSVILASLLLKLGGYGIVRFLFWIPFARFYFQPFVITICLISILYASIIAIRQVDIKRIVAYSSIAHINFALLGFFSNTIYGIIGGMILIISHGIVSGALFLLVGVLYDRHHTRTIYYYSGLAQVIPLFATITFLFIISNFSFPGTSNFVGELLVILGLGFGPYIILIIAAVSTFFTLVYTLLLMNRILFGNLSTQFIKTFFDINRREFNILWPLIALNIIIGIAPSVIMYTCYPGLQLLVNNTTVEQANMEAIFKYLWDIYEDKELYIQYVIEGKDIPLDK